MLVEREKCLGSAVCCWYVMCAVPFPVSFASATTGVAHRVHYHSWDKPYCNLVLQEELNSGAFTRSALQRLIHFYAIIHSKC